MEWLNFYSSDISNNERPSEEEERTAELAFERRMEKSGYSSMKNLRYDNDLSKKMTEGIAPECPYKFGHVFTAELR